MQLNLEQSKFGRRSLYRRLNFAVTAGSTYLATYDINNTFQRLYKMSMKGELSFVASRNLAGQH